MQRRSRTTKTLAQRIDLNYFKRSYPIPRWRRNLSLALVASGMLWLGWSALAGKPQPFNAGPLSHSHALFTRNCAVCHAAKSAFARWVTNQACLTCHDGAIHQAKQTFTPDCASCHAEHRGEARVAEMGDRSCTQCHASLAVKNGRLEVAQSITGFDRDHPEFAVLRGSDPGTIKFGHAIHMKSGLRGPHGAVQLKCVDCHTPAANGYMSAVNYEKHCADCHALNFDVRIAPAAPHKKPEIVIDFVRRQFAEYIARHPDEVHREEAADTRIVRSAMPLAKNATEWIERRVADTETLLWRKSCVECHTLNGVPGAMPAVVDSAITTRWMKHAQFDHRAHQMLDCTQCHTQAMKSDKTSDVLLPGIDACRGCHRPGTETAGANCAECHLYHDRSKSKFVNGAMTISAAGGAAHP